MNKIVYYNLIYKCNNNCKFCFSHNVGIKNDEVLIKDFICNVKNQKLSKEDLLVINGGEPTVYSDFLELLLYVQKLECNTIIYSNGTLLSEFSHVVKSNNIKFVVPILGSKSIHDELTRVYGSYDRTINSLLELQSYGVRYDVKFILSSEAIGLDLDFEELLMFYDLHPESVVLARMNGTKKSRMNHYNLPQNDKEKIFFQRCVERLSLSHSLVFLDFPPCYFTEEQEALVSNEVHNMIDDTEFYFNDCNQVMHKRKYIKKRLNFSECKGCKYSEVCDLMSSSYYVLKYLKAKGNIVLELE